MKRPASVAAVLFFLSQLGASCGSPPPAPKCGGEERPPLNCESEFKYDGRKIEGGFSAIGIGSLNAKTDETALRAIDRETEQYAAQSRRLCDEYNKCVLDKEAYATRSENLRRRMSKVPELYDAVKAAPDDESRRKALSAAYSQLVSDENRRELALDFAVEAQRPGEGAPRAIREGDKLPTGTKVAFLVRASKSAYVYLFQKTPDGKVAPLFPDPRIATKNPIASGAQLRLPPNEKNFVLNDKDVGAERVYVVASLDPVSSLEGAMAKLASGSEPSGALAQVTRATSGGKNCTRALELDEGPTCVRPRGLEYEDGPGGASNARSTSFRARTEAADSVIVQVFSFDHTP